MHLIGNDVLRSIKIDNFENKQLLNFFSLIFFFFFLLQAKNKLEIVETTRQNADFRKKLANCQREIIQLAEVSLREKHDYLSRVSSIYQQALQEENAALQSVDVFKLMTLQTAQLVDLFSLMIYLVQSTSILHSKVFKSLILALFYNSPMMS